MYIKYRPDIDGLRALAVILVIFFHAGISHFKNGFIGVDVFFVISGYLIGFKILSELKSGCFSFITFYEKRARRILPMLFLIAIVSSVIAWFFMTRDEMISFSKSLSSSIFFSSNIIFWREASYWDNSIDFKPLIHTWSLSIEEQFYLVFPIFLFSLRKSHYRIKFTAITIITIISFTLGYFVMQNSPNQAFFSLHTRLWELSTGCLIASMVLYFPTITNSIRMNSILINALSIVGLLFIIGPVFIIKNKVLWPSVFTIFPVAGTALILFLGTEKNYISRILSLKPFVFIGLISYSAYLWHQPILVYLRYLVFPSPSIWQLSTALFLIIPLSYASYRFIETPFRDITKFNGKTILIISIVFSTSIFTFGCIGYLSEGFPNRSFVKKMSILNYESNNSKLRDESWKNLREKSKNLKYSIVNNSFDREPWFDKNDSRDCILLVGNSHSKDVYNTFLSCKVATDSFQIARYGVQNAELVSKTHSLYNSPNYKQSRIIVLASLHSATDLDIFPRIIENIKEDGKLIVILKNVHRFTTHGRKTLADFYIHDKIKKTNGFEKDSFEVANLVQRINHEYFIRKTEAKINHINKNISKLGFKDDVVLVLDRMDYICDTAKKECYVINENLEKYLYDYGHNTLAGAQFYGKRISEIDWLRDVFDLMEKNESKVSSTKTKY